jgi:hypothetical protein
MQTKMDSDRACRLWKSFTEGALCAYMYVYYVHIYTHNIYIHFKLPDIKIQHYLIDYDSNLVVKHTVRNLDLCAVIVMRPSEQRHSSIYHERKRFLHVI